MAIAFDAVSASLIRTGAADDTNTTGDITTVSASATYALCLLEASLQGGNNDSNISFTTASLEGTAESHLANAKSHSGGGTTGFVDVYNLASPPTGSAITQSLTEHSGISGSIHNLLAFALTFTGALDASPLGTPQLANGTFVSSLTVTDTLATGDLFVAICCNGSSAPTVTTGTSQATATGDASTSSHGGIRIATNSGTGSISIVFGTNSADNSAAVGVKLIASTGGAALDVPLLRPVPQFNVHRM
jgi:hypothetical protein